MSTITRDVADMYSEDDKNLFKRVFESATPRLLETFLANKRHGFKKWLAFDVVKRKEIAQDEERKKAIDIMVTSKRGDRTVLERETLRRFIIGNLSCIPSKDMTFADMDCLCNEIDWYPVIGKSIIMLQGDFGNCYYMIATGRVALYLESSKDREMVIGREFGQYRGKEFKEPLEKLEGLGKNIFTLPTGAGFGEFAILSTTQKLRSCAAVSIEDKSFLFIMHGETYDKVLKQHHYRQRTLSIACKLLQELPLFQKFTFSKISQVAYTMRSQLYSVNTKIVNAGDPVKCIYVIGNGNVKVFPNNKHTIDKTEKGPINSKVSSNLTEMVKKIEKRLPKLAVALLGRGTLLGEYELQKRYNNFQMNYIASTNDCEVFEIPLNIFTECISSPSLRQSTLYENLTNYGIVREKINKERISSAFKSFKSMMTQGDIYMQETKKELMSVLPNIVEEESFPVYNNNHYKPNKQLVNYASTPINHTNITTDMNKDMFIHTTEASHYEALGNNMNNMAITENSLFNKSHAMTPTSTMKSNSLSPQRASIKSSMISNASYTDTQDASLLRVSLLSTFPISNKHTTSSPRKIKIANNNGPFNNTTKAL